MNGPQEQKIEVKPSTLVNLVVDVGAGRYRVPQFQREYVWTKKKVIELLDSIYHEYPIGSFFIWKGPPEHNRLFRQTVELNVPPVKENDSVSFILDGQQRIVSLYVTLNGLTVNETDYSRICFDLQKEAFTDRVADGKRYVSVCDIWGPNAVTLMRRVEGGGLGAFERCFQVLRTYPISIVEVRDKDLPAVCKIFQRINQSGKRLDRFDLISAMTFTSDFNLRERFKSDLVKRLERTHFGAISPVVVTQLLALLKSGQCTERDEFSLTTGDIKGMWSSAVDAILLAADTLRMNLGVVNASYLPYDALLTLLAYYFMKSKVRSLPAKHLQWVSEWFWRASFSRHYGSAGPTQMGRDRELFDALIEGRVGHFDPGVKLTVENLLETRMTWTATATRNAFLCLLAAKKPVHLVNNSPLDLVNGGISDFTSNEKHHIFPHAYLLRNGPSGADIHALPNFCFLPAELNKRISDSDPATYFKEFRSENPQCDTALRTHCILDNEDAGIQSNDYLRFLRTRAQLILEEIERLCGKITVPREGERLVTIESLEGQLRDLIHRVLVQGRGENYWKTNIPPDVREEAKKRIGAVPGRLAGGKAEEVLSARTRLDFCNVMDYVKIVENGANWGYFEKTFHRKQDLRAHMENFNNYRNAVMHNRQMTELAQRSGEAAILWLRMILSPDQEEAEPELPEVE